MVGTADWTAATRWPQHNDRFGISLKWSHGDGAADHNGGYLRAHDCCSGWICRRMWLHDSACRTNASTSHIVRSIDWLRAGSPLYIAMNCADLGSSDLKNALSHHARRLRVYATGWIIRHRQATGMRAHAADRVAASGAMRIWRREMSRHVARLTEDRLARTAPRSAAAAPGGGGMMDA
jgi:hypothetical protein